MATRALRLIVVVLALCVLVSPAVHADTTNDGLHFRDLNISSDQFMVGQVATVQFSVADDEGNLITGLTPRAVLRPTSTADDTSPPQPILTTIGREYDEPGRYELSVALNEAGRWWLEITASSDEDQQIRYDHFVMVEDTANEAPAVRGQPLFFPGEDWGVYYRVDPTTGTVVTVNGEDVLRGGDAWLLASAHLNPVGSITQKYGGTWQLQFDLTDGLTNANVASFDMGEIRASTYTGSTSEPAIATSVTVSDDGNRAYMYYARQLGQGWLATVAVADIETGTILEQRTLRGAISGNGYWAELSLSEDGQQLVVAEQVVQLASISGYRLSVLNAETLETVTEHRNPSAGDDPLTHCMLSYPGPSGLINDGGMTRYSLCSPPSANNDPELVIWDTMSATVNHSIDIGTVAEGGTNFVDGVATPDGSRFFAVNSLTKELVEIDMESGSVLRTVNLLPEEPDEPEGEEPSPLDRFFDWFRSGITPDNAHAGVVVEPGVSMSPDGTRLYIVATNADGTSGDGIWEVNTETLDVTNRFLPGTNIAGMIVADDGNLAVVQRSDNNLGDEISILSPAGDTLLSLYLPNQPENLGAFAE